MVRINDNLYELINNDSFYDISKKIKQYKEKNPYNNLLSLGVGDVSRPVAKSVIKAMHDAVNDLGSMETFKGYGASFGYDFLKEKILNEEYKNFNFTLDEIYISNGTKSDTSNILELFDKNCSILITNPIYPIYKDGAICLNRKVKIVETNNFVPKIPNEKYDIIYICSPNNPTGICYTHKELREWIEYAIKNNSVILYDNVYSSFIRSKDKVKSIYEIQGAKKVAIEFKSFSKNASFTGVRCSYYIIPNEIYDGINDIWKRRTLNRFNGADYIAQKGAYESYSVSAQKEIKQNIDYYMENAKYLIDNFTKMGFTIYGGIDSPFLWIKIKEEISSMEYFNFLLNELNIVVIPGIIFGKSGDKYFRVSALANREVIEECIERLKKHYEKV